MEHKMPGKGSKSKSAPRTDTTEPTAWAKNTHGLETLTCPSGQTCQIRRLGPTEMLKRGLLDRFDLLGQLIKTEHIDRVEGRSLDADLSPEERAAAQQARVDTELREAMQDPKRIADLLRMIDDIMLASIVKPKIWPEPAEDEEFVEGRAYLSFIYDEDKMFIFNRCMGGGDDAESFREGLSKAMGDLAAKPEVQQDAVGAS